MPQSNGPQWKKKYTYESDHYLVISNVSQSLSTEIAQHLEHAFLAYSYNFPAAKLRNDKKARVIIFESQLQFMEYTYLTRDLLSSSIAGFYSPVMKELALFDSDEQDDTVLTTYHEGFHQFLDIFLKDVPICFNEGMAEYFAASKIQGGKFTTGLINRWRLATIQKAIEEDNFVPLKNLLNYTKEQYYENASLCYAEGWSLMHFLLHAGGESYRPLLRNYFKALHAGKSKEDAFQEGFSKANWKTLTQEWRRYVKSLR